MKKRPVEMRLQTIERGIVLSGLTASSPKAVELSKPTRLKMATTTPSPRVLKEAPLNVNCAASRAKPCLPKTITQMSRMKKQENASSPSMTSVEILMSL